MWFNKWIVTHRRNSVSANTINAFGAVVSNKRVVCKIKSLHYLDIKSLLWAQSLFLNPVRVLSAPSPSPFTLNDECIIQHPVCKRMTYVFLLRIISSYTIKVSYITFCRSSYLLLLWDTIHIFASTIPYGLYFICYVGNVSYIAVVELTICYYRVYILCFILNHTWMVPCMNPTYLQYHSKTWLWGHTTETYL